MILLDSQAALWVLLDGPRLGPAARRMIASSPVVHVSAASVWELEIKSMLGKIDLPDGLLGLIVDQGLAMLPVSGEHAAGLRGFPELVRHDPFDRMIIAQAAVDGLTLVTADRVLLGLGRDFVVDAAV